MCLKQVVPPVCPSRGSGDDFRIDYTEFSKTLNDQHFPKNQYWMMVGPTGPRRLRLAIEHLANERGAPATSWILTPVG